MEIDKKNILVTGFLKKWSPKLFAGWQNRFFELNNEILRYWKIEEDYKQKRHPLGIILFNRVHIKTTTNDGDFTIELTMKGLSRCFYLKASSYSQYDVWKDCINQSIARSNGFLNNLELDEQKFKLNPWKYNFISEYSFLKQAQNGDMLLFRGSNTLSNLQRFYSKGDVDHAGLVLMVGNEVFIVDASGGTGVSFMSWDNYKATNDRYEEVIYRKLNTNRDEEWIERYEDLIRKVQGNGYSVDISNILMKKGTRKGVELEDREFFCSELVIKCYKEMGLIITDKGSGEYLPSSLSAKTDDPIELVTGSSLDDDMIIEM